MLQGILTPLLTHVDRDRDVNRLIPRMGSPI